MGAEHDGPTPEAELWAAGVAGPPWILGHRGVPRDAPENTLASLRRALALGLDGVEYDVQSALGGDPVLLHDDTVTRTTDGRGAVEDLSLPELVHLDAGGWFHKRFAGEPVPHLDDALALERGFGDPPLHMIELKRRDLVSAVVERLREAGDRFPVRIASFHREVVLAARDAEYPAMLLAVRAEPADLEFVRRERIDAHGLAAFGWRTPAGRAAWPCERWAWSVDAPDDLLEACRTPLFGFNTNEPLRALAARALVKLCPNDPGPWPLQVEPLEVVPGAQGLRGEWTGAWTVPVRVRNPFPVRALVTLGLAVRRGAFEVEGGPGELELAAGEERETALRLVGGSWSPGPDPSLVARFELAKGPVRPRAWRVAREFALDAPLVRVRTAVAREGTTRLECLRESPTDRGASLTMRRRGGSLLLSIESAGGLEEASLLAHLDGETHYGTQGLRLRLPAEFDTRTDGVAFSAAVAGRDPERGGALVYRRWAGGLPGDLLSGSPGVLLPRERA